MNIRKLAFYLVIVTTLITGFQGRNIEAILWLILGQLMIQNGLD